MLGRFGIGSFLWWLVFVVGVLVLLWIAALNLRGVLLPERLRLAGHALVRCQLALRARSRLRQRAGVVRGAGLRVELVLPHVLLHHARVFLVVQVRQRVVLGVLTLRVLALAEYSALEVLEGDHYHCYVVQTLSVKRVLQHRLHAKPTLIVDVARLL